MTEMFMLEADLEDEDAQDRQHDDVADHFPQLEFVAAQRGDAGPARPAPETCRCVSSSSAKATMPIVTMVIGRHFGGSTTSTCVARRGVRSAPSMLTRTQISRRARHARDREQQEPVAGQGDEPGRRCQKRAATIADRQDEQDGRHADRNPDRFLLARLWPFAKSGTRLMMVPRTSMMSGQHVGHVARPHAHRRAERQVAPELQCHQPEGDEHHPGQEVLAQESIQRCLPGAYVFDVRFWVRNPRTGT